MKNKKIDIDYENLAASLLPLLKQKPDFHKATESLVSIANEIGKVLEPNSNLKTIATQNMSEALIPLVRTVQLNNIGLDSRDIAKLIDAGKLERVKQGYYRISELAEEDSEARVIAQLYPDGVVCMTTALFYYGYSDRTPLTWDIAIDRNTSKSRFNIDYPYVNPYYMEKHHLEYGVTYAEYEVCKLRIFDRDRLICECIKHENKMERETFNKAIQGYINDNQKNISNLLNYAKKRNIQNKVKERIEVWL